MDASKGSLERHFRNGVAFLFVPTPVKSRSFLNNYYGLPDYFKWPCSANSGQMENKEKPRTMVGSDTKRCFCIQAAFLRLEKTIRHMRPEPNSHTAAAMWSGAG